MAFAQACHWEVGAAYTFQSFILFVVGFACLILVVTGAVPDLLTTADHITTGTDGLHMLYFCRVGLCIVEVDQSINNNPWHCISEACYPWQIA
jgi:hypothetical protein